MKITYSKIFSFIIFLATCMSLEYYKMLPLDFGEFNIPFVIALTGIGLALVVSRIKKNSEYFSCIRIVNRFAVTLFISLIVSIFVSVIKLEYGVVDILKAVIPYCYYFYAYPIVYIFTQDKSFILLKKVSCAVLLMLFLKVLIWYFYNFYGIVIFEKLLFKYGFWIRNDMLRVESCYLFGIVFALYLSYISQKKNQILSVGVVTGMILYTLFVLQSRFQLICLIATLVLCIYLFNYKKINIFKVVSILTIILLIVGGAATSIANMFSTSNVIYGGSTSTRIDCIAHYWQIMKEQLAFCGLGLLDTSIDNAIPLMDNTYYPIGSWYFRYYLDDIGIFGGFVRFGILGFFIYGLLYKYAFCTIRVSIRDLKENDNLTAIGIVIYMLFSCLALNIFDLQRAFDVPFYLAIISYVSGKKIFCDNKSLDR